MVPQALKELIAQGEGLTLEFKLAKQQLSRNVFETVCAFLNRHGGTILLGVGDDGAVEGVDPDWVAQIKKDFVTAINNPQKLNPACYLSVDSFDLAGKTVLNIYVPESSQVHRCNGRIYDRNEDGDFDITDHTRLVADMYHRKQTSYSENKIYPFASASDLRNDLLGKCRKIAGRLRPDHPWLHMDDMELLKSAQLYQTNPESGESGITLAGILLVGSDNLILTAVPHHRTDLILRKVNRDRYDDRELVTTNLIESYERIMAFGAKHLPDPFFLEGDTRVSLREAIIREVASNMLIHREYLNAFPAKFIIESGVVRTENSNKPHGHGRVMPDSFSPFPKNPVIARFFREVGRADELGSGMRNLMKYGKAYGGADPEMIEGDVFRMLVPVPEFGAATEETEAGTGQVAGQVTGQVAGQEDEWKRNVLLACLEPKKSTEIQQIVGIRHRETFQRNYLDPLLADNLVERTIPDKPQSRLQQYRTTNHGRDLLGLPTDGE